MKPFRFNLVWGAAFVFLCALVVGSAVRSHAQVSEGGFGVGTPDAFLRKYVVFRAGQLAKSARHLLVVRLGYVKGLSRSFTSMAGEFAVDLDSGAFKLSLDSLTPSQSYGVWLVDAIETTDTQAASDTVVRLATVRATGATAAITGVLDPGALKLPPGFTIDRVVVAPGTASPAAPLASGSVNVFQKIFFRRLSLLNDSTASVLFEERTAAPKLSNLVPDLAAETDTSWPARALPLSTWRRRSTLFRRQPGPRVRCDSIGSSRGARPCFSRIRSVATAARAEPVTPRAITSRSIRTSSKSCPATIRSS